MRICVIYFYYYYSKVSKGIARRPTIGSMEPNKQKEVDTNTTKKTKNQQLRQQ